MHTRVHVFTYVSTHTHNYTCAHLHIHINTLLFHPHLSFSNLRTSCMITHYPGTPVGQCLACRTDALSSTPRCPVYSANCPSFGPTTYFVVVSVPPLCLSFRCSAHCCSSPAVCGASSSFVLYCLDSCSLGCSSCVNSRSSSSRSSSLR